MTKGNSETSPYLLSDLRAAVSERRVLAIIGTGVAISASGGSATASWAGLLRHGVQRCIDLYGDKLKGWSERAFQEIDSGDLDELLAVAHKVASRLDAPTGGEYRVWLRDAVGSLEVKDPSVIQALAKLNIPLATTNYDGLIEQVTGFSPVTWRNAPVVEQLLRKDRTGILHLHGYWDEPESVILDIRSYEKILHDDFAQLIQQVFRTSSTLLFVGYGRGLADPNFGSLLRWSRALFSGSGYRHFRIVRRDEVEIVTNEHERAERIFVLSYGDTYSELAPFINGLLPDSGSPVNSSEIVPSIPVQFKVTSATDKMKEEARSQPKTMVAGRDQELAVLHDLGIQNPNSTIVIIGPSGYGKTVVARQLVTELGDGSVEAYVDASTIFSVESLVERLVALFPEQAWSAMLKYGGLRVDQLDLHSMESFLVHLVLQANCCLVVDHAEAWLGEEALETIHEIHVAIAVLVREISHTACILTSLKAPVVQLPYRVVTYPLGPTDKEKGVAILERYIAAPKKTLLYITQRFHGHPYILDIIARRFAGSYRSRDSKEKLNREVSELPDVVTNLLVQYIVSLPSVEEYVLFAMATFRQPMPSSWVGHEIATSLYEKGFLAHKVDLDDETSGWIVHPLVNEAITLVPAFRVHAQTSLRNILQSAVQGGHALASLPLAYLSAESGNSAEAFSVANDYWRLWCESRGINEGLHFIESLAHDSALSPSNHLNLLFAAGVLHLYKGDRTNLTIAQDYFEQVSKARDIAQNSQGLYWAAVAEQMEATRRLNGMYASSDLYVALVGRPRLEQNKPEDAYHLGIIFFLLGHVHRYAESFETALDLYSRANRIFQTCRNMNCILEEKHTIYCIGMSQLKSGDYEAASSTIDRSGQFDDQRRLTFIGGLFNYLQSAIALAQNEIEYAEVLAKESIESLKRFQSYTYGARAELLLAWIKLLSGRKEEASELFASLLSRPFLPQIYIGRAECGFALAAQRQELDEHSWYVQRGIQRLIASADIVGAMTVVRYCIESGGSRIKCGGLKVNWIEIDRDNLSLRTKSEEIADTSLDDLYKTLKSIRPHVTDSMTEITGLI